MKPLSSRMSAWGYLGSVFGGFALFGPEPFVFSLMGIIALLQLPVLLFTVLPPEVHFFAFFITIILLCLIAVFGWSLWLAVALVLKDALIPGLFRELSQATPRVVAFIAWSMILGITALLLVPEGEKNPPVNLAWYFIPFALLGISEYERVSRRKGSVPGA